MRRTVLATMLVALLSVQQHSVHAEPGPVGQWLMKEPVTMWTFGMGQLRNYLYSTFVTFNADVGALELQLDVKVD